QTDDLSFNFTQFRRDTRPGKHRLPPLAPQLHTGLKKTEGQLVFGVGMSTIRIGIALVSFLSCAPACLGAQTASAPATQADVKALQDAISAARMNADNAWMLVSAALVLLMTGPGLALFYGGLVRRKNILGTMMQSFAMMGLITILW